MSQPEKFEATSANITDEQKAKLKSLFPEIVTEGGKIDFDRLKLTLGETVDVGKERYGMNWPGKADCFKTIQRPSMATLVPAQDESVNFDTTENLIIEGDNLETLKLLQKAYLGKVKMIYIDPPYNTGKDFIYPDDYSETLETYLQYTGQVDEEGRKFSTNAETDGRFHSKWMNMIYPRLFLARNLLREDGVIFISINDHELDNLRKVCDEVFGEENFLACLTWTNHEGGGGSDSKYFRIKHEYIVVYARQIDEVNIKGVNITNKDRYTQQDEHFKERGPYYLQKLGMGSIQYSKSLDYAIEAPDKSLIYPGTPENRACWRWSKEKYNWGVLNGFIVIKKDRDDTWQVHTKQYLKCDNEGNPLERTNRPIGVIDKYSSTQASKELQEIFGAKVYDYSKPTELIQSLIQLICTQNDLVLDFFAGSGTTAQAVLEQNVQDKVSLRFILIQLPEPTEQKEYPTIADITKERVRRIITKLNKDAENQLTLEKVKSQDRGFKVFKLQSSNFKAWNAEQPKDDAELVKQLTLHTDHLVEGRTQEDVLYELLLKSGFPLDTKVEKIMLAEKNVFSVAGGAMLICLEKELTPEVIKGMADKKPERVVCLDAGFSDNDQLKTNAVQTMKSKGVTKFQTV